ncbi:MAG: hypothetical protein N2652_12485 [Kiritimatiellae bacterium]|nr:hypothetical protein [Kiritimatiellia bacterium]
MGATAEIQGRVETAFWSKYLFRGQIYTDGPVLQPALTLSAGDAWSVTTWMNVDLSDANSVAGREARGRPTEVDVIGLWSPQLRWPIRPSLGCATYVVSMPTAAAGTTAELMAALRWDPPEWCARWAPSLSATLWHEVLEYDDAYLELAAERHLPLVAGLELLWRTTVGYGGGDYHAFFFTPHGTPPEAVPDRRGWSDFAATAELGRPLGPRWRAALMLQYQMLLEHTVRSAAHERYGGAEWWVWGVKVSAAL